jgi:hypothetical protein
MGSFRRKGPRSTARSENAARRVPEPRVYQTNPILSEAALSDVPRRRAQWRSIMGGLSPSSAWSLCRDVSQDQLTRAHGRASRGQPLSAPRVRTAPAGGALHRDHIDVPCDRGPIDGERFHNSPTRRSSPATSSSPRILAATRARPCGASSRPPAPRCSSCPLHSSWDPNPIQQDFPNSRSEAGNQLLDRIRLFMGVQNVCNTRDESE